MIKKMTIALLGLMMILPTYSENNCLEWWRQARFGMFIHWGLYSAAAGEWNGKEVPGIGEWIQNIGQIPNQEYETLIKQFTLSKYNPEAWVLMAKNAGVGYIVFTAKHHDGFCLYPSAVTDYDIERTSYKGDPLKQLIDACRKYQIRVGIYYSHRQDWHEEDAAVLEKEYDGHFGKPKSEVKPNLDAYLKNKALPQVRELLSNYGPIDVLWFDTPFDLKKEQAQLFVDEVHKIQPNCIINGRVGFGLGDYGMLGDNEMPCATAKKDLEMVATMNHTWGYKKNDQEWKNKKDILCSLIESASRGINYMVNIGPKEDGTVPQPSIDIFEYIAQWMKSNSEAIYGTTANPFNDNFPWGYVTQKNENLYLHLIQQPQNQEIVLKGLNSKILKATLLANGGSLSCIHSHHNYILKLPKDLDYDQVPVVKLVCSAPFAVDKSNYENQGFVSMPVASASFKAGSHGVIKLSEGGNTANFNPTTGTIQFNCEIDQPGNYEIRLITSRHWRKSFTKGTYVTLQADKTLLKHCLLQEDGQFKNVRSNSYPESWSVIGNVAFKKKGVKQFTLSVDEIGQYFKKGVAGEDLHSENDDNLRLMRVELHKL